MRTRFHTTIEKDLITAIKVKAAQEGKNVNDILEEIIKAYLNIDSMEDSNECDKEK
jgi:predicted DNA binding CopG/RHH family protein